jgi:DNA polymerase-3 subunit delta
MVILIESIYRKEIYKCLEDKIKSISPKFDKSEIINYDCLVTPIQNVVDDALTISMFSPIKIVVAINPVFLLKDKSKLSKSLHDTKSLLNILNSDDKSYYLFILAEGECDLKSNIVSTLNKRKEQYYLFPKLKEFEIKEKIQEALKKNKILIKPNAETEFINRVSRDLNALDNEIEKLLLYGQMVDLDALEELTPRVLEDRVYLLANAVINKNLKEIFSLFNDFQVNKKISVILIINQLGTQFRKFYQALYLKKTNMKVEDAAVQLNMPAWQVRKIYNEFGLIEPDVLLLHLSKLSELDLKIKQGKGNDVQLFERYLI